MSIEKQICHRFQGPLGLNGTRHSVQRHIKVLQTLEGALRCRML